MEYLIAGVVVGIGFSLYWVGWLRGHAEGKHKQRIEDLTERERHDR